MKSILFSGVIVILGVLFLVPQALATACDSEQNKRSVDIAVYPFHDEPDSLPPSYEISWLLLNAAAEAVCIQLEPVPMPWNAALNRVKAGEINLLFGAFVTPEREQWGKFSYPLADSYSSLLSLPGGPIQTLKDADKAEHLVAAVTGSVDEQDALAMGFENIYPINSLDLLMPAMKSGRIDLIKCTDALHYRLCNIELNQPYPCLNEIHRSLVGDGIRVLTPSDNAEGVALISRLNDGLENIHTQGTLADDQVDAERSSLIRQWQANMKKVLSQ